jgi:hypothetical protein
VKHRPPAAACVTLTFKYSFPVNKELSDQKCKTHFVKVGDKIVDFILYRV